MRIIAFGASTSRQSINKQWASYVAHLWTDHDSEILDLNNYPLPIYSIDLEKEEGIPEAAIHFVNKLEEAELLIISLAEHNGAYTAAFKNIFDWSTRYKRKLFEGKKVILLSTSPGSRGGQTVLEMAVNRFPRHGAYIVATFSLPDFRKNFDPETQSLIDGDLKSKFKDWWSSVNQRLGI